MLIENLLWRKGHFVISIDAAASIAKAMVVMAREEIGALVVLDGDRRLLGIVSEREIVAAMATHGASAFAASVESIMITNGPVAAPHDTVAKIMQVMTTRRARHVPVVADGAVVGVVSIGDVVQSRLQEKIVENGVLQDMARAHLLAA